MNRSREQTLRELGLGPLWKLRAPAPVEVVAAPTASAGPAKDERAAAISSMDWDELKPAVAGCRACALCQARKQAVLGVGDVNAD